jgi:hypothetical protein
MAAKGVVKLPRPQEMWAMRLRVAMGQSKMCTADLSVWFDRSYHTVRSWLYDGKQPHEDNFRAEDARTRLVLLENIIRRSKRAKGFGIPIPTSVPQPLRKAFVKKVYQNATREVPREIIW